MTTEEELTMRKEELIEEPAATRLPVVFVVDISYSMAGPPETELNEGLPILFNGIKADPIAAASAEIAIVTFGTTVETVSDFHPVHKQQAPRLVANGGTPMGAAVNRALDMVHQCKETYRNAGIDYMQPWLWLLTDGQPTDNIEEAVRRTVDLVQKKKLTVFAVGIGDGADMNVLRRFSPNRPPIKLKGLTFDGLFAFIAKSVSAVSRSTPGQSVPLDTTGMSQWAQVPT